MRSAVAVSFALVALLAAHQAHATAALVVTSTANDGPNTLRQAILDANADPLPGPVTITFAIGLGPKTIALTSALPPITHPVIIDGTTQPGFVNAPLIEIDGENVPGGSSGLLLQNHSGSTIRGLVINRFDADVAGNGGFGVLIATASDGHVIAGNYLGTDLTGTQARPNSAAGIFVQGGMVTIGGTTTADRNVISGNGEWGVAIDDGAGTVISGNYIGVTADGAVALANSFQAILAVFRADSITIGGIAPGAGNVIAGGNDQILLATSGHDVHGNFIGTNADGTAAIGGGGHGVRITDFSESCTIDDNLFGAPFEAAIVLENQAKAIKIHGNRIGLDVTGSHAIPLAGYGILVQNGAFGSPTDVTIGGVGAGDGNLITNCTHAGVAVRGGSILGGPDTSSTGIAIRGNAIFANGGLGIDLDDDGVTPNDADDTDQKSNGRQNFPVLTSAVPGAADLLVTGSLTSLPNSTYTIDFYASTDAHPTGFGEGQTYLGSTDLATGAGGTLAINLSLPVVVADGTFITATATDPGGNTSEFSAAIAAGAATTSTTTSSTTTTTGITSTTTTTSTVSTTTSTSAPSTSTTTTAATTSTTTSTTAPSTSTTTSTASTSTTTSTTAPSTSTTTATATTSTTTSTTAPSTSTTTTTATTSTSTTTSTTPSTSTTTTSVTTSTTTSTTVPTTSTTTTAVTTSTTATTTTSTTASTLATSSTTVTSTTGTTVTSTTATSTTVATTSTTTSTTLPLCHTSGIPQILCLLDGVPPASCSGDVLPKVVTQGLAAGRNMLAKAQTATAKRARRLETATAARFHKLRVPLATAAKKHKVSPPCAAELGASLEQLRGLTTGLLAP